MNMSASFLERDPRVRKNVPVRGGAKQPGSQKSGSNAKASGKRKAPELSPETSRDAQNTRNQVKRAKTTAKDARPSRDSELPVKEELAWMRQEEQKRYLLLQPWLVANDLLWRGCDVNKENRAEVINWLMVIHHGLELEENSLFVAVNLLDRYVQHGQLTNKALKPIALSCLWIAAKLGDFYYEIPSERMLMKLLGPSHTLDELRLCERMVLRAVGFHLWFPTALQFAEKYASVLPIELRSSIREKMYSALELCLRDSSMSSQNPSKIAISALSFALGLGTGDMAKTLKDVSGYDINTMHVMVINICNAAFHTYQQDEADPIYTKYQNAFDPNSNEYLNYRIMSKKK